jgi:hypothetical protein
VSAEAHPFRSNPAGGTNLRIVKADHSGSGASYLDSHIRRLGQLLLHEERLSRVNGSRPTYRRRRSRDSEVDRLSSRRYRTSPSAGSRNLTRKLALIAAPPSSEGCVWAAQPSLSRANSRPRGTNETRSSLSIAGTGSRRGTEARTRSASSGRHPAG